MRWLLRMVLLAALLWSGYWFIGAGATEHAATTWLGDRREEGWQVEYTDLGVKGFPNRFDTTITDVDLTDPDTGISWSAPFFQLFALSYKPNHLIAVWPNEQTFATPYQKVAITTEKMSASLVVKPTTTLELDRANLVMNSAEFESDAGWKAGFKDMRAAIRETENKPLSYDIALHANALIPGDAIRSFLDQSGKLPDLIEGVRLDTEVSFAEPLDLSVIEDARPDITALIIKEARGTWGELQLRAKGDLTIDPDGIPEGNLAINARNWREMLDLAIRSGVLPEDVGPVVEKGLGILAGTSGNSQSIDVPLSFARGLVFIGPLPIGPAPRITLR